MRKRRLQVEALLGKDEMLFSLTAFPRSVNLRVPMAKNWSWKSLKKIQYFIFWQNWVSRFHIPLIRASAIDEPHQVAVLAVRGHHWSSSIQKHVQEYQMQEGTKGKESLLLISYSFLQRQTAYDECQNQCASGITAMADKKFEILIRKISKESSQKLHRRLYTME